MIWWGEVWRRRKSVTEQVEEDRGGRRPNGHGGVQQSSVRQSSNSRPHVTVTEVYCTRPRSATFSLTERLFSEIFFFSSSQSTIACIIHTASQRWGAAGYACWPRCAPPWRWPRPPIHISNRTPSRPRRCPTVWRSSTCTRWTDASPSPRTTTCSPCTTPANCSMAPSSIQGKRIQSFL